MATQIKKIKSKTHWFCTVSLTPSLKCEGKKNTLFEKNLKKKNTTVDTHVADSLRYTAEKHHDIDQLYSNNFLNVLFSSVEK